MRFWLAKGISGFRCDVINILWKSSLADSRKLIRGIEHYVSQPNVHEILHTLRRDVLSRYDCFAVGETIFVTPETLRGISATICTASSTWCSRSSTWRPTSFSSSGSRAASTPGASAKSSPSGSACFGWNANYLENHDQPRSVSRFGDDGQYWAESAKMLATLLLSLRGTPFIYQGQEIGMTNFDFTSMDQVQDVESYSIWRTAKKRLHIPAGLRWRMIRARSRDNARTPVQWDESENGGFTAGIPWLGVNANAYAHQHGRTDERPRFGAQLLQADDCPPGGQQRIEVRRVPPDRREEAYVLLRARIRGERVPHPVELQPHSAGGALQRRGADLQLRARIVRRHPAAVRGRHHRKGGGGMIEEKDGLFRLTTDNTSCWFRVTQFGHLEHIHYGERLAEQDPEGLALKRTRDVRQQRALR